MAPHFAPKGAQLNQTHKFCAHESLDCFPKLRLYFLLLVTGFIASHLALNITTPMSLYTDIEPSAYAFSYIFPCLTALFCAFSYSGFFSKYKSPKIANLRLFLNFTAAMMLVGYLALFSSQNDVKNSPDDSQEGWANGHPALPTPFYIIFILTAVCTTFILKVVLVVFYYVLLCVLYIEIDDPGFGWMLARNVCGCLLLIALLGLFSNFRWQSFLKLMELEEWNKVYRDILDRNPSSIAVIDTSGNVMYSNPGFQDLAHNNPEAFFQSVTNLKCRDINNSVNLQQLFNFNMNLLSPGPSPLTPISSEESLMKQRHSILSNTNKRGTGFSRMSTKARMNTLHSFANLWQLLSHYRSCIEKETLEKDAQLVFDGKGAGKLTVTEQPKSKDAGKEFALSERETRRATINAPTNMTSYEIIIRPCPGYKKLIVILNNTTERDLIVGLENNSEFKDKVLASVSHELRTPLNGNLGYLQAALNDRKVQERVKSKFLLPAFRSGKLLLHVIDDILDYSQLQTKGLKLKVEAKSLSETLNYCYELLEHSFKSKGLKLRIKLSDDLPKLFRTDHKRLKQILLNLLTNAIKFTMQGGVTIKASCLADSRVEIKVEDTGLGIKQQSIQKLFGETLFNQGLGFKEVNSKGAGLGLKISQKLAELLSDDSGNELPIQVQSVYGKGSCFYFIIKEFSEDEISEDSFVTNYKDKDQIQEEHHLSMGSLIGSGLSQGEVPLEHLNEDETILHEPMKNYFKIKKPFYIDSSIGSPFERRRTIGTERGFLPQKILIVDDDQMNILVLESFIGQFGLISDSANNGKEALEKVMNCPDGYKLILMDCQMPVMDGFEATEQLNKKMEEGEIPVIPIIGCTAFSGADKLKQCLKSGMKEVLSKPVMKDQIGDVLKRYLGIGAN